MRVLEFQPAHLTAVLAQGGEAFAGVSTLMREPGYAQLLKQAGDAWTLADRHTIIGCGGIAHEHENLGVAWTLLNPIASSRHMVMIDRVARRLLSNCPRRRIQATTDPAFDAGKRWLTMLGFKFEGLLEQYTPDGRDQLLYARIKR